MLYYNDSVYAEKFNIMFDDGNVLNLHAELGYRAGEKFNLALHVDQYAYSMDLQLKAWHKPQSEVGLSAKYNLRDKVVVKAEILGYGKSYAYTYNASEIVP